MSKIDYDKKYLKKPELQDFRKELENENQDKYKEGGYAFHKNKIYKVEPRVEKQDGPQLLWGAFYIELPGGAKFKFQPRILAHLLITQYGIVRVKGSHRICQLDPETNNYHTMTREDITLLCCDDMNDYTLISFEEVKQALEYVHRVISLELVEIGG